MKTLNQLGAVLFIIVQLTQAVWAADDVLRIIAWHGYADADWVAEFERDHDVRIEVSFVESDDELWEKLSKNHGADYDVFAANTAELQRYISHDIAAPIKINKISNIKNQLPRFRETEKIAGLVHNGNLYGIPFTYSEMGLIYDSKQFKTAPTSMSALWQPENKGKIILYDGSNHNFSLAALLLEFSNPFQLSNDEMSKTVKKLLQLRSQNPMFYTGPEESIRMFLKHKAALMFANYGQQQLKQLQKTNSDIAYIIPKEGALAWLDCWGITVAAKNKSLAEQWINFTLEKNISAALSRRQGLPNTLLAGHLKEDDKIIWLEPSEDFALRSQYWERLRAGKARRQNNTSQ
ncbi:MULTISPECIES: extracellular solute-binding protein [Deefgea]|uniref:Extracellular solute-binding protein n=1 Tax=Deefgea chitinilytica TaxID=570276 RepID=A0ABS2CCW3_9NEIS|nr:MULTISPECIES: extracellular solute-binding protein [Deefgea]MBM5571970.1 extracellular solute-binding protein [Deefgea chitinilytica]MBM9889205.1 extracellular solute-binding protein [Deefgea sp. CFH1-16]